MFLVAFVCVNQLVPSTLNTLEWQENSSVITLHFFSMSWILTKKRHKPRLCNFWQKNEKKRTGKLFSYSSQFFLSMSWILSYCFLAVDFVCLALVAWGYLEFSFTNELMFLCPIWHLIPIKPHPQKKEPKTKNKIWWSYDNERKKKKKNLTLKKKIKTKQFDAIGNTQDVIFTKTTHVHEDTQLNYIRRRSYVNSQFAYK